MAASTRRLLLSLLVTCISVTGRQYSRDGTAIRTHMESLHHEPGLDPNHPVVGRKSRSLLSTTTTQPDYDSLIVAMTNFTKEISDLSAISDTTQLLQHIGNDVITYTRTKLGQVNAIFQSLESLTTDASGDTNHTLTDALSSTLYDVISAVERLGGVALHLTTATRISVSAGALEMLIVKERRENFRGFVFDSSGGPLPVYISVPQKAGPDNMAGVVAFSLQMAPRVLSGGTAASVATPVVVCSVMDAAGRTLPVTTLEPVTFTLGQGGVRPDKERHEIAVCSFMTSDTSGTFSGWSNTSCHLVSDSGTEVTCRCYHLSAFAVLYQQDLLGATINMLSWASCAFTTLAALITVMTFIGYRLLQTDRSYVRINFLVALGLAESVFLTGTRYTDVPAVCYLVAGTLHCCCVACSTWLFSYILLLGTEMRMTNIYRRILTTGVFTVIGWGLPICIVMVTMIWRYTDYRHGDYCWISSAYMVQLSFLVPIGWMFLVSWVMLVYVIYLYVKLKNDVTRRTLVAVTWSGIRSCTIISPLVTGTWVTAAFVIVFKTILLQAIFAACNVLLGCTIFFSMCFLNEEVRLARRQRKVAPAKKEEKFVPQAIEVETFVDGCESGNCIHQSKCFYGQLGFEQRRGGAGGPGEEARETPVAQLEVPQTVEKAPGFPTPKILDLVSRTTKPGRTEMRKAEAPVRSDSTAHLLPEVEVHKEN